MERRKCEQVSLLFWQRCLVFYIIGIWTYKFSAPGLCSVFLAFIFLAPRKLFLSLFLVLFFLAGLGIAHLIYPRPPLKVPAPILRGQKIYFAGKIAKITSLPDHKLRLFIEDVQINSKSTLAADGYSATSGCTSLPGRLLLIWENPHTWPLPGQEISGRLRIKPVHGLVNEGCWNSEFYWHRQKVYFRGYYFDKNSTSSSLTLTPSPPTLRNILRQKISHIFDRYFPDEPGIKGLALALLMNEKYFLSSEFVDQVRLSSLGHTLALSGLHLGLIIVLGFCLSYLIGLVCPHVYLYLPRPKLAIILAIPLIFIYLWLGQAPVSLVRAAIMFFSWAILYLRNRNRIFIDGFFYALLLIVLANPLSIFDLSLQLSFLAVLSIGLTYPYLTRLFTRFFLSGRLKQAPGSRGLGRVYLGKLGKYFIVLTAMTMAANLGLLPLQAWAFGYISPHIYLNLFWLPVLGFLALPLGFVGVLFLFVPLLENLAQYFFYVMGLVLKELIVVLDFLHARDLLHPIVTPRPGWEQMLAFWFVFLAFIYRSRLWQRKINLFLGVILIVFINFFSMTLNNFNGIKLRLLDVGQGQSILCELPGKKRILIDGGGSWSLRFDLGKYIVTPAITWKAWPRLDRVFLTHSDIDHLRGLYYPLSYLKVEDFIFNGVWPGGKDKQLLTRALSLGGEKVRVTGRGDVWDMGQGVKIVILHPGRNFVSTKNNNRSLVMILKWKNRNLALIAGDIEREGIKHLLGYNDALQSDVLILPHHGSRTSFSEEFYRRVKPEIALVSAGFLNRFHLPHRKVVNYLKKMGCRVLNTATHGEIQVFWSGWNKPARVSWCR